jgi:NACHT domain
MDEHNARCLANTRVELRHQIAEWAEDRNGKPIFWLKGMAGTGKSTIARSVAQSFADKHQLAASFFFKKGEGERGNATRFFTTIATDLMAHIPGSILGIRKALDADPGISERVLKDQFEKLILHPLLEIQQAPSQALAYIVVIDALDECEREEDIRSILKLLARTKDIKPMSLRILVTSRPELPIHFGFKQMSDGTYQDLVLHEVPQRTIERDIRLFLEHELREIQKQRSLSPNWPREDQIQALVKLAIPLFIFASTVCRYIADRRDNPTKRLEVVLRYQSATYVSNLDRTYLPILSQLFDDEDEADKQRRTSEFRDIVGSIVVLESPLSISSLARFFQISKEDVRCRLDSLHSVLSIPDSGDLPVRLLHQSFRDFLVDPQKKGKSPFWVDEREIHERLAGKCLELLSSSEGLRQNMCKLLNPGTLRSEIDEQKIAICLPPELQYACRYWVHHLEQSGSHIHDGDPTYLFLQKHLLHWLEAMSLIREAYKCIYMINRLQTLAEVRSFFAFYCNLYTYLFAVRHEHCLKFSP